MRYNTTLKMEQIKISSMKYHPLTAQLGHLEPDALELSIKKQIGQ